jgi:hypothetical protein
MYAKECYQKTNQFMVAWEEGGEHEKKMARLFFIALALPALTACGGAFQVNVNSFSNNDGMSGKSYILLPGNKGVTPVDLQFKEYAGYVRKALEKRGFIRAVDFEKASVAVFLRYGIGDPQRQYYSYSMPLFGQTGGGTSTFSASTFGGRGTTTTTGTISTPPRFGVVGSVSGTDSYDVYHRYLILEAVDIEAFKKTQQIGRRWGRS